jgi:hypothetical protein
MRLPEQDETPQPLPPVQDSRPAPLASHGGAFFFAQTPGAPPEIDSASHATGLINSSYTMPSLWLGVTEQADQRRAQRPLGPETEGPLSLHRIGLPTGATGGDFSE